MKETYCFNEKNKNVQAAVSVKMKIIEQLLGR